MKKIGVLFSLTGTTSVTEIGQYRAALFALQEYNRNVKDSRELVEFVVRDIQSDPDKTMSEAKSLIQEGIRVFIGTYTSACRKALLQLFEEHDCLLIYPALYEGHEIHPNVLYTGEVPNQQVLPLLKYIKNHFGSNIYLIGNDYIYPKATNDEVKKYWAALEGKVVGERYVPFGHSNYMDIFEDIDKSGVNAIFSTLVGESVVPFYRTFKGLGFDPRLLPIFSPITKETEIKAIGARYTEGHFSGGSYFQSLDLKENHLFVQQLKNEFEDTQVISSVMFNTYLGTKMVLEKLVSYERFETRAFLDALTDHNFETPSGMIRVEKENHHISRPIRIGQINSHGQFTIVWDSKKLVSAKPYDTINSNASEKIEIVDWSSLFEEFSLETKDAYILLNEHDEVLYANAIANSKFNIYEGQLRTVTEINNNNKEYNVTINRPSNHKSYRIIQINKEPDVKVDNKQRLMRFDIIKTVNEGYQQQLKIACAATNSDANVLILGETGVGKEVLAHAIHKQSNRKNGPFIAINAGALPRDLVASELFGFVEGAFTGAVKGGRKGKFELADGGTLFLDEIGEMPLDLQITLLRVLETKVIVRLGDHKERKIDVRFLAATNRNLQEEIAYQGTFRADLYYRLNVMSVTIPALRERNEDIRLLVKDLLDSFINYYRTGPSNLSEEALQLLRSYSWPGNIRELRNVIERSFLLAKSKDDYMIDVEHLPSELTIKQMPPKHSSDTLLLEEVEKQTIQKALSTTNNISRAAQLLGISRSTLYRKMKMHSLT
ncbi:transporter substrate-binding protein [Alkalihalobacterium elongatum]|uniref:transporter substrate-binding protein n=1 Tax=Alkalihalobacterium elongatum TaxID=2675466 RepID=UPI001C1F5B02|nr:transporter substrate-binding protein [Alkalihalobacterium elongatum]